LRGERLAQPLGQPVQGDWVAANRQANVPRALKKISGNYGDAVSGQKSLRNVRVGPKSATRGNKNGPPRGFTVGTLS
jgi:hypothetical protein